MILNVKNKTIPKLLVSLILTVVMMCGVTAVHADDSVDVSFYERSSAVMHAFGNTLAPSATDMKSSGTSYLLTRSDGGSINAGQAAGLLGYADNASDQKGVVGWLTSSFSNSSSTFSYDQLSKIPLPNGKTVTTDSSGKILQQNALTTYAYYGKALHDMGLDKTTADGGGIVNKIFGLIVQGVYMLSSLAPLMFSVALKFLMVLNPFLLFDTVIQFGSKSDSILGAAAGYVGKLYSTITQFSTGFLIPIFFAVTLFSIFIFRSTKASNKIWRYVLRVFVIVTAVPLIGATYTGTLKNLKDNTTTSSKYADYLVYSSFVDFEGWAKQTRLAPPNADYSNKNTTSIAVKANGEVDGSDIPSRALVLAINKLSHPDVSFLDGTSDTKDNIWNTIGADGGKDDANLKSAVSDMLRRYTDGDLYTSSDYEGYAKASINEKMRPNGISSPSATKGINKMITIKSDDFESNAQLGIFGSNPNFDTNNTKSNADDDFMGIYHQSIYNAGELTRDPQTNVYKTSHVSDVILGGKIEPIGDKSAGAGLTPLGMYNYLNTEFNTTSMTVYSSDKSSSAFVKRSHYSVVFAGDNFGLLIGMISLIAVMTSLTIVSLVYSFGMIRIAFASIPRITAGVFGTTFGSLGSFAKLLVSTLILIIEIVGSMFLYSFTENIMVSIMANLDTFATIMGLGGNANALSKSTTILINLFTIILAIIIMIVSIKNRKKFVKIFEEVANEAIKKLMGGLDNVANNGNPFYDGGAGMQKAMSDGASQYKQHAAINADQNPNGKSGKSGEKKSGIRQLATEAIGENNRIAHKMARSGEFDAQTPAQAMANSSEILGRKAGAALKDKALGFIGLEGHNLERDNEYAKQKEHALDEYLRPEMQRDALDDIQGYKQSDDDAYNEELKAAGLDGESSDTDSFMRGADADKSGMADVMDIDSNDARVDADGNPIAETGEAKASDISADKDPKDKEGIKSELLKKPNMKDIERAKNGASAGGYMGAGAAVVGGRVKDAVSKKAVDTMNDKLSGDSESKSDIAADKNAKDFKSNQNGIRSKVKDYASATKQIGPGFKRGFGQAMNNKYNVSGSSDYKQSLHSALVGTDAMRARSNSMSVLKKNGISSYGEYKSKLFDIDKGIDSAKKNESKYASDVAKLGATPDGRNSEQYQRATANLASAQAQRASLVNQRKTLHSHASGLLQQKGLAINGVTSRPFTGNPNAALSMIGQLRSLQNQSGNFRGKSDSKSRKELGNITSKMSDIRNELSNSGFVVSNLNSLRDIDTFKRQFEDGYTDFFKGKKY